jgi:beta-glucosidase
VGIVGLPATDKAADIEATRDWMFSIDRKNLWTNTWWMDPVFRGAYPQDGLDAFGPDGPEIRDGDLETIHQPLDFFGMNTYWGHPIRAGKRGRPEELGYGTGHKLTLFHWAVTPDCLYWGPKLFHERYQLPVVVTENGMTCIDWVARDGQVHDPQRIDYTARHLAALKKAGDDGVPLMGYMHWSIIDNFEWAEGYKHRFGLIYVDFETQERTMKDSAHWYQQIIAVNGENI